MTSAEELSRAETRLYLAETEAWQNGALPEPGEGQSTLAGEQDRYLTRNRLFLLGYLNNSQARRADFERGLAQFIKEAGIPPKPRTPDAAADILELCTRFEREGEVSGKLEELPEIIRYRVAALRLRAYRLHDRLFPFSKKGKISPRALKSIDASFKKFCAVFQALGLPMRVPRDDGGNLVFKPQEYMFRQLMDHDEIVKHLGTFDDVIDTRVKASTGRREKERKALVLKFAAGVAAVELWLNGYNSSPVPATNGNEKQAFAASLSEAISDFWHDQLKEDAPKRRSRKQYTGALFRRLAAIQSATQGLSDDDYDVEIREGMAAVDADNGARKKLEKKMLKSLGARIWDGIKRAARAIFGFVRGLFRKARNLIRNLTRLIRSIVPRAYEYVVRVIKTLAAGIGYLFSRTPRFANDPRILRLEKAIDGDMKLLLGGKDRGRALKIMNRTALVASTLKNSALIFGTLLRLFAGAIVMNWLDFVVAVARIGARWKEYAAAFGEMECKGAELIAIEAELSVV